MNIVCLDRKTLGDDISLDKFEQFGTLVSYDSTTPSQTLSRVKDAQIIITNKVLINKDIIDNSNIKLICVAATGMNNIDLEYAKQKGIEVRNVAGYSTSSVAQLTIAYVLQFVNQISYYDQYVKSAQWEKSDIFTHLDKPFYDLKDKIWGIIGLGNIGQEVAKIARAMGINIQYYSTSGNNNNTQYNQVDLDTLLSTSNIISIHSPLNDQTNNLINKNNLSKIQDSSILLNLGRGGIVNEEDISNELDSRELYFATDVVSKEPIESTSPLLKVKNKHQMLFTPHIAWASKEARERLVDGIFNNIKEFIK
jgi:glycerate dehydrogenase